METISKLARCTCEIKSRTAKTKSSIQKEDDFSLANWTEKGRN
jgi:hypothetical protein